MTSISFLLILLIFVGFAVIMPIVIGGYVYRDANRRGMNGILWALVAALVPSFAGLIIYLLVRGNYSDLRCPKCEAPVNNQFVVCPKCGAKLRPVCPNCSMPVEADWRVCPKCAQPLEAPEDISVPVRAKDRSLWKVLAIVVLVPALLIVGIFIARGTAFSHVSSTSFRESTFAEYASEMDTAGSAAVKERVMAWYEELPRDYGHAYALQYDYDAGSGKAHYFLVYVPGASNSHIRQASGIFGTTLTLELRSTGNDGSFFNLVSSADKAPNLKIVLDGKKISCDVTVVDYNPTVYEIVSQYEGPEPAATIPCVQTFTGVTTS